MLNRRKEKLRWPLITARAMCVAWSMISITHAAVAQTRPVRPISVVATPNPNVFPLLLALDRHPQLPVTLLAVSDGASMDKAFAEQSADAVLAMTPTIASKVATGAFPPLRLTDITLWRGFAAIVMGNAPARTLFDLKGKGFIVSGTTTGGDGGGPDLLFQAAMKRSGLKPKDLLICYLPVKVGVDWLMEHKPLGDHANCEPDKDVPAVAMLLVEPAVSAVSLMSRMPFRPSVDARIDIEPIFTGFTAWPLDQLPHGGLAVRITTLDDKARADAVHQLRVAYAEAIDEINAARDRPITRMGLARTIAKGFDRYYAHMGLELPAFALANALGDKRLVYRRDLPVEAVSNDLLRLMDEVLGRKVLPSFYR